MPQNGTDLQATENPSIRLEGNRHHVQCHAGYSCEEKLVNVTGTAPDTAMRDWYSEL